MEYPPPSLGTGQSNYPQHLQDQTRISPGYNSQPSSGVFPSPGASPHHRTYAPYPQTYQPSHEFNGPQSPHTASHPSHTYPPDGHGQGLTLNQLLQQGNSSGSYPIRPGVGPGGQTSYRTHEQFPCGYRSGIPGNIADRPQGSACHYQGSMQNRYPDPYGRPAYATYPGPAYPYYQIPHIQQHRQPIATPSAADYPTPNSTVSSPSLSQLPSSAGSAPVVDRPPSTHGSIQCHPSSASPVPPLSSPVHTNGTSNTPTSGWTVNTPPFGSPHHTNHGQVSMQLPTRPCSSSREPQFLRPSTDSSEPPISNQNDKISDSSAVVITDEPSSRPHSHMNESGRLHLAGSTGLGSIESTEDQRVHVAGVTEGVPSASATGPFESCPPSSSFTSNPSSSPIPTTPRTTLSTQLPAVISSPSNSFQPGHSVTQTSSLGVVQSRFPSQSIQPTRSYAMPHGSPMNRQPYPPYLSQPPHPSLMQPGGHCMSGSRPPAFYPGTGQSARYMTPVSMHPSSSPIGTPRGPGASSHFPSQSGAAGPSMMPPPSAPPPSTGQPGLSGSSPLSQMGFMTANSYVPPSSTGGSPYASAPASTMWDPHSNSLAHPSTTATSGASQLQSYTPGRSSASYCGSSEREAEYSSPHNTTSITPSGPSAIVHSQTPIPAGAYSQPPSVSSYHSHVASYPSNQPPYQPSSYLLGVGPGSPTHAQQQHLQQGMPSVNWSGLPPPYPSGAMAPTGAPAQPTREHFHHQYGPHCSERGPSFCPTDPTSPNSLSTVARGPGVSAAGVPKMISCGANIKMEQGIRSLTPCGVPVPASSQQNANSSVPQGLGGPSAEDQGAPLNHPQPSQLPPSMISHANHGTMQHFSGGYWPDNNPCNQFSPLLPGAQSSHAYPPFQLQQPQQHYRSVSSHLHAHYQHGVPNSTGGPPGGAMYGSPVAPHNSGHLHPGTHSFSSQSLNGFQKLMEMGTEPERRGWLEHYIRFMEEIGKPLVGLPQVVKQPLDLYRFYLAVRERGGVLEVIKSRRWKEISQLVNINASASAAYTLRKNYCKFLLDYECRFDRGGADPRPLLSLIDAMSGKKKKVSSNDNESNCGHGGSLSGAGAQTPAPPSPAGSHSSASSSLLPPGSGSASLSGVPTAGSAASDSQMGSSSQHQLRFNESSQSLNSSLVIDGTNGTSGSPAPGSGFLPGPNVPSPRRPPSVSTTINGFVSVSHGTPEPTTRPSASWSWSSEGNLSIPPSATQPLSMGVNGFSSSPVRGPLAAHVVQTGSFDAGGRLQYMVPNSTNKSAVPHASPTGNVLAPVPATLTSTCTSGLSPPSPSMTIAGLGFPTSCSNGPDPTVHHHPGTCPSATGSTCSLGPSPHPNVPQHMQPGHHNPSVGASVSQPPLPPRLAMSMGIRSSTLTLPTAGPPTSVTDQVAVLCMHPSRPPVSAQTGSYLPGVLPPFTGPTNPPSSGVPAHLVHHHGQRSGYVTTILKRVEHCPFPPGTIEATQIEPTRRRRCRSKDIGPIVPFKLLMALRSGLTAEVSWALNCLNILLRDESGLEFLTPSTLPTLITNLVEIWRHSLGEMFDHELFVTSLELPTDLSSCTGSSIGCDQDESSGSQHTPFLQPSNRMTSTFRLRHGGHIDSIISPTGLASIERDIISLAAARNVPLSSLRKGIRRLLRKCDDSPMHTFPIRARNGLIMRIDTRNSVTSVSSTISNSCTSSDSVLTFGSRPKKRTKLINSLTYSVVSSAGLSTSPLVTNSTTPDSSVVAMPYFIHKTDVSNGCATTVRVNTTSTNLRSPQACANLRELALCVIDELSKSDHGPDSNASGLNRHSISRSNLCVKGNTCKAVHAPSSADHLRQLFFHGGGDTTCHIMPPFGALALPSRHWSGDAVDITAFRKCQPSGPSSTPPPTVVREKCSSLDEVVDHEESGSLIDDYEGQPLNKRARHVSTSSLSCPILSPQPIDELIDQSASSSNSGTRNTADSAFKREDSDQEHFRENADDEDTEFSQLVVDANGQCPLRAREELVHHGSTCLWPSNAEAVSNEARAVRCLCVSTVLRNLSFLTVAESHLSCHKGTLSLIGRVLLLGHEHVGPLDTWQTVEMAAQAMEASLCAWRTPSWLEDMRENALVLLVNIAGYLNLINFEESIVRPVLEGLVHWITCSTALSIDSFPGHRTLSPRRLALEAVNRLCVHESNVDLLLSTSKPNQSDLSKLFDRLAHWLALPEDQVTRELALSTMHYLTGGGVSLSHSSDAVPGKALTADQTSTFSLPTNFIGTTMLALAKPCPIAGLLAFIEAAEATTRRVIEQLGVQALQERPELMGTSLEMVRRAGSLLDRLAADPTGRLRFTPNLELRLMDLVTSRVLDATVAHLLCGALHRLSPIRSLNSEPVIPLVPPTPSLIAVAELLKSTKAEGANVSKPEHDLKGMTHSGSLPSHTAVDVIISPGPRENGAFSATTQVSAPDPSISILTNADAIKVEEETVSPIVLNGDAACSAVDEVPVKQSQANDHLHNTHTDSSTGKNETKSLVSATDISISRNCIDS